MQSINTIRAAIATILCGLCVSPLVAGDAEDSAKIVEVKKIWDRGEHNAFTDLLRFQDRWFCVFREGKGHVSPDGAIRVLTSDDGDNWTSAARITLDTWDLRDAKISVTPENRLMIVAAGARRAPDEPEHRSYTFFSDDGSHWTDANEVGDVNFWLWRVTWHGSTGYGIGYPTGKQGRSLRLYKTADGKTFDTLVENLFDKGYPNETSIIFTPEGTALCLVRRDGDPSSALLATAKSPYTEWTWQDLSTRIGGPHMLRLNDGRIVAAGRRYDGKVRTALLWLDPDAGTLEEFLALPSGGDTSYPGLVFHNGLLWVSYYSSHEGRTSIYLAKVKLPSAP